MIPNKIAGRAVQYVRTYDRTNRNHIICGLSCDELRTRKYRIIVTSFHIISRDTIASTLGSKQGTPLRVEYEHDTPTLNLLPPEAPGE
jgi:hypothetical protein